tara:strand:- start:209 stop:838 length:630 start_codon:yes stop_codon:yes gene_type:complete
MINVTYAITVHNELEEITKLINFLHPRIQSDDEILVQYDTNGATKAVIDYLRIIEQLHTNVKVIDFPLNKDFASFKNNIKNHADGIFIFQIDADEIPNEYLVANMHDLLEANLDIDLFFVPRVNTVEGLTDAHIKKWGWNVNNDGWVNWPDLQTRIYRRTSEIQWEGKVHERIKGYNTLTILPQEEPFAIYHPKEIERQTKQNALYDTI